MKRYLPLILAAAFALGARGAWAQSPPYLVNCELPSTPCTYPGGAVVTNSGDPPYIWAGKDNANTLALFAQIGTYTDSVQTPTTVFSITIPASTQVLVLNPAGTLATGTITMPASPIDKQNVCVTSSQAITALTVSPNAGQSIIAAPLSMGVGGFCYHYVLSLTTWFRLY
jgi:hypothetical protein